MAGAKTVCVAILAAIVLPGPTPTQVAADLPPPDGTYTSHSPIRILSDTEFCIPNGTGGWVDTGVVNCDTADGSRAKPYVISGWSIDTHQATGLEGIGARVENVRKNFVISHNYVYNGSRFAWNASVGVNLELRSDDQLLPSDYTPAGQIVRVDHNVVAEFRRGLRMGPSIGGVIDPRWGQTFRFVSNNSFLDNEQGIFVMMPTTFEHNEIWNSSAQAVWQSDDMANYVLRGNDIRNTPIGFSLSPCPFLLADVRPIVEHNNFINTTDWAILQRGCTDVVLAPNNYWGHASGPSYRRLQDGTVDPILDSLGVPDFFVGEGGRVTYGVLFAPWRLEENPDAGPVPAN